MEKISRLGLIAILGFAIALSSCKEDEDKMSKTDILTSKTWSASKAEVSFGTSTIDVTSNWLQECQKDNTAKFLENGTYNQYIGEDDCDGDEQDSEGTWAWESNETVLNILIGGNTQKWTIVTFGSNVIKLNVGKMAFDTNHDSVNDQDVDILVTFTGK